jgi:hypothetical protein
MIKNKADSKKPRRRIFLQINPDAGASISFIERRFMTFMLLPPCFVKKLQRATCDRRDLDRRFLHLSKCFKEVETALNCKKKK